MHKVLDSSGHKVLDSSVHKVLDSAQNAVGAYFVASKVIYVGIAGLQVSSRKR